MTFGVVAINREISSVNGVSRVSPTTKSSDSDDNDNGGDSRVSRRECRYRIVVVCLPRERRFQETTNENGSADEMSSKP